MVSLLPEHAAQSAREEVGARKVQGGKGESRGKRPAIVILRF